MSKTLEQVCFAGAVVTHIEFQNALNERAQAKLMAAPLPLTDAETRARIEFLKADNARMRAALEQHKAAPMREREIQAKVAAERLMRQMRGEPPR